MRCADMKFKTPSELNKAYKCRRLNKAYELDSGSEYQASVKVQ